MNMSNCDSKTVQDCAEYMKKLGFGEKTAERFSASAETVFRICGNRCDFSSPGFGREQLLDAMDSAGITLPFERNELMCALRWMKKYLSASAENKPVRIIPSPPFTDAVTAFLPGTAPAYEKLKAYFAEHPENTDPAVIKEKLNVYASCYRKPAFRTEEAAEQIASLCIDEKLSGGDEDAVKLLSVIRVDGKPKDFYSFATRYANAHCPQYFPVYDAKAAGALRFFRDEYEFYWFSPQELKNYGKYKKLLAIFRRKCAPGQFTADEISRWLSSLSL